MDGLEVKHISNAELGRLRPPSEADIQRRATAYNQTSAQQQAQRQAMARIEKNAMQFVAIKQQEQQPKMPARAEPANTKARHNSVAQTSYGDQAGKEQRGRAKVPEHVAIQRSIQGHIQRNQQREARNERLRQLGRDVKDKATSMLKPLKRSERNMAQLIPSPTQGRTQSVQSELTGKHQLQSMRWHRERTQSKEPAREQSHAKAPAMQQTPARQPQQQKGKEQERGRTR